MKIMLKKCRTRRSEYMFVFNIIVTLFYLLLCLFSFSFKKEIFVYFFIIIIKKLKVMNLLNVLVEI